MPNMTAPALISPRALRIMANTNTGFRPLTDDEYHGFCGADETTRIVWIEDVAYLIDRDGRIEAYPDGDSEADAGFCAPGETEWESY